jgi:hypothetical protein
VDRWATDDWSVVMSAGAGVTTASILTLHVAAGAIALLAGGAGLSFQKGSATHRMAGNAFFLSMLVMAASGALIAYLMPVMLSVVGSVLTLYLLATAWAIVAHGTGRPGWFEVGALVVALALGAGSLMWGFEAMNSETGLKDGFPAPPYFIFGSVALLGAAGDFRLILPRGIRGAPRIARHLWRMCFALFIASSAFFLGQAQLFPAVIRHTPALWILGFLPLFLLAYWVVRVRFTGWYGRSGHES